MVLYYQALKRLYFSITLSRKSNVKSAVKESTRDWKRDKSSLVTLCNKKVLFACEFYVYFTSYLQYDYTSGLDINDLQNI